MIESINTIIDTFTHFITVGIPSFSTLVDDVLNFGIPDVVTLGDVLTSPTAFIALFGYGIIR